jgi:hypothetical protein
MSLDQVPITRRGMITAAAGAAAGFAAGAAFPGTALTTILDGAVQVAGPHPIFGESVSAAEVQDLAAQHFLPADRMAISFTCLGRKG